MIDFEDIDQFILDLDRAKSSGEMRAIALKSMIGLGFTYFAYVTSVLPDGSQGCFYIGNYPASWSVQYRQERYFSDDPVMPHRLGTVAPYSWKEVKERLVLTARQKRMIGEIGEFGLKSGGVIPLYGPGALRATFAVAGEEEDSAFARRFMHQRHRLHLMANYLHDRLIPFMQQGSSAAPAKITERESEVLVWTARGKTSWEISRLLDISDETVRHHLKSICRKLGVNNKTHAASLCIAQGILRP